MISDRLAVNAPEAARLCGVSVTRWRLLHRSGRCPEPIRLGRALIWRVNDLRAWLEAGCPPRNAAQAERWRAERCAELGAIRGDGTNSAG